MIYLLNKHSGVNEFKRDNTDYMNNFWIKIVATSFTGIEDIWAQTAHN